MNVHPHQEKFYAARIADLQHSLDTLYRRRRLLGWFRLLTVLATIAVLYATWQASTTAVIVVAIAGFALFLFVVSKDVANKKNIANLETLLAINRQEIAIAAGNYLDRMDGTPYAPEHHGYAADLDLFGKASLFQYANRCNAPEAQALFAAHLLQPLSSADIAERQEAIQELAGKPLWCQQLQAYGKQQQIDPATGQRVAEWLQAPDTVFTAAGWKILTYVFPVITLSALYLFLDGVLPSPVFSILIFCCYLFSLYTSKQITATYHRLSGIVQDIGVVQNELQWFEQENVTSTRLVAMQQQISGRHEKASAAIARLQQLLNRFDVRLNVFAFIFLNTFLLWDLRQLLALRQWKQQHHQQVPAWFSTVAAIEELATLGTLAFNHPHWCFPSLSGNHFTLEGKNIGHPLIPEHQRVTNDYSISGTAQVHLVTGSNMAGKSTFLRSLGLNMVLACTGAPVCATAFSIYPAQLMSSMRITDNLAENTSTFYAELKKLQTIIEAVNSRAPVFILLDEILRGTNSLDRHTGSAALIRQLIRQQAVAVIATHDVELAKLEQEFPGSIANYHFDVQVSGEELYFDYMLKQGICTSLNASLLMKKIGIDLS